MFNNLSANFIENPTNWILAAVLIYITINVVFPKKVTAPPPKHPPVIELKDYTPRELSTYNGATEETNNRILIAVKRHVFDVSHASGFYGPGGMYGNFAGRDASRGLAKNSFDSNVLVSVDGEIDTLKDLTEAERVALEEWFQFYSSKYNRVGTLIENKKK